MKRFACLALAWMTSACASQSDPGAAMSRFDQCLSRGDDLAEVMEIDNNVLVAHGEIRAMALGSTGQMALASADGAIKLWSIRGEAEGTAAPEVGYDAAFGEGNPAIGALAYEPGGAWIASGRDSGEVATWSATSGEQLHARTFSEAPIESVDVSPDGERVAIAHVGTDLRVWQPGAPEPEALSTQLWGVAAVRYLPGGELVTAGHDYGTPALEVRAAGDPATVDWSWGDLKRSGWLRAVAASPDGRHMAAGGDDLLLLFDLEAPDVEPIVSEVEGSLRSLVFSPGGEHVLATDDSGAVRVFSARDAGEVSRLSSRDLVGVYSHADMEQLVTAERGGVIRILGCGQ